LEALRQRALLLELTPVLIRDAEDRIIYWNRSAELLYGFGREQALGRISHDLLQTKLPEPLERILARLRTGRQWQGDLRQVRSDGARITVSSEWVAYLDQAGELEAVIEVNHEITDRKRAEDALASTTARFDSIIRSAMDAIITTDASQAIVLFNPAAERMFGVTAAEVLGQSLERLLPPRYRGAHAGHVEEFGRTGATARRMGALGKIYGLRANGEEFPIEASISKVGSGTEMLYTVILRDITHRERAERELNDAQAALQKHLAGLEQSVAERTARLRESNDELEAFSYSLSHDMRAPLRAIHTFTSIVLEDHGAEMPPPATEMLHRVIAAADRMNRLMNDVLAYSRVSRQSVVLRPMVLEQLIQSVIVEHPELHAANIHVETPLLPVQGDEASLTQCLVNLLSNATKFVPPGVKPEIRVRTEPSGDMVRLCVEDNGIGIELRDQSKLFTLFHRVQSDYEGSGLGLAIVKRAAERMGGSVGVISERGKGSRFWIELQRGRA